MQNIKTITILVLALAFQTVGGQNSWDKLKHGKIRINGNSYKTYQGSIEVPENYDAKDSKLIPLSLYIIKSNSTKRQEPVFFLDGGPGASNIKKTGNHYLLEHHDFVCVGYRGIDGAVKLTSKKLCRAARGLNHQILSEKSIKNFKNELTQYFVSLEKQGMDYRLYRVPNVIHDIDYVRHHLGYQQINLLSISYGTRLALLYDLKFPGVVKRSVMVGANPPKHFIWWSSMNEKIIAKYDELYQNQPFRYKGPGSIKQAMEKAFAQVPKKWSLFRLDPEKIRMAVFMMMYDRDMAAIAFDAVFKAAYRKDYSGFCAMQKFYNYMSSRNVWGDMFIKGSIDYDPDVDFVAQLAQEAESTLGSAYSKFLWGAMPEILKSISIPREYKNIRKTPTETLVISGSLDISTPSDYATNELMPFLINGKQVVLENSSHADLINKQIENYRKTVASYFDSGILRDNAFDRDQVEFKPKKNLNLLTKILYPFLFLIK
ncbi:alpha/beta hydrolase [Flavobacterium sp. CYK-4]|uniref:alpha/beta fold hydrolase n=1 Tax=Flavobacterium lotistagni TaxID=2709660 RepID=UPI00140C51A0|nr:alpha/beta fold hydrolase [Flavobacterium lotistagni]NHM06188.1 alpha/beta hydrolase [Flavobacterium lotistagni]